MTAGPARVTLTRGGRMSRWLVLVLALVGGCNNACQSVCGEMAKVAEDCGINVSNADMDSCIAAERDATRDERKACAKYGDAETIAGEWDCNEIGSYFGSGTDETDAAE